MITIETLTIFFGWCTVINIGILTLSTLLLIVFRNPLTNIHSKLIGIDKALLPSSYFSYLSYYKIAIIVLNITPYIALRLMGS